jgi:NodT family efflux transporter outer membrane factor (OMF) lipoprotein
MNRYLSTIPAVCIAALSACAAGPDYRQPDVAVSSNYRYANEIAPSPEAAADSAWWEGFHDPVMAAAIRGALAQNLDIAQAAARVAEARAAVAGADAALLPQADLDSSAASTRDSLRSPIGQVAHAVGAPRSYRTYTVAPQASWEIDLFGARRRADEAAVAHAQASEVEVEAVRVAISAETADAYLELRSLQAQLHLAQAQEATQAHLAQLVALRFGQGVSSKRELQRATADLERVRASIPPLRAAIEGQLYRLDVLMGTPAGTHRNELASDERGQPSPPRPAGSAAPADLLRRRPDIVIAERRLAASNARIGVAIAEYYPHVSLQGLLGWESVETGALFSASAQQSGGILGLRWRLFDFGRVDAEVAAARGREAQELAAYRSAVLRATQEVESALSQLVESRSEALVLVRQIDALTSARDQAQQAYAAGVLPLIDVLDAERELLAASDRLAVARANEARAAVASYRALGGGWSG